MATYTKLEGVERFQRKLQVLSKRVGKERTEVTIGYAAHYALRVHEDLVTPHRVGKAKFLEGPMRRYRNQAAKIARDAMERKRPIGEALRLAGDFILRKSKQEVPIDTGFLRDSGFVSVK